MCSDGILRQEIKGMASENSTIADSNTNITESLTTTIAATTTELKPVQPTTYNDETASSAPPNVGMVIGITVSATVLVFIALFVALFFRRKYLRKKKKPLPNPLPNPNDIDKIAWEARSKKIKKSNKNKKQKHNYEKDPTSTPSIEPEAPSCPAFMAPDPPSSSSADYENAPSKKRQLELKLKASDSISSNSTSEPKYVNTKKKDQNVDDDEYVAPKPNTARLYSTGEGAEYYVCDKDKSAPKPPKAWKAPPRNPLEDSITSNCSALDYVNMHGTWKYLELVPESKPVDEPQDLYEPMNS